MLSFAFLERLKEGKGSSRTPREEQCHRRARLSARIRKKPGGTRSVLFKVLAGSGSDM